MSSKRILYAFLSLATGIGLTLGLSWSRYELHSKLEQLVAEGKTTEGILTMEHTKETASTDQDGITTYFYLVKYEFKVDDQDYNGVYKTRVPPHRERPIEVWYLFNNPSENYPRAKQELEKLGWPWGFGLVFGSPFLLGFWGFLRKKKEKKDGIDYY